MRAQILAAMALREARPLLDALIAADEAIVDVLHRLARPRDPGRYRPGRGRRAAASQHSEAVTVLAEKSGNPTRRSTPRLCGDRA
jgi:hypothetical protein